MHNLYRWLPISLLLFQLDIALCVICDDSCLTCSTSIACLTCEDTMYLNTTTNLCQFCAYGQYYDPTYQECRDCNGKCIKSCGYQTTCFSCPTGEMLDTDTMSCVSTCNSPKLQIQSSQFTISSFCRGTNFYVDPTSSAILELGTQAYPYRSARAVFSEILNLHSHRNVNLTVYF